MGRTQKSIPLKKTLNPSGTNNNTVEAGALRLLPEQGRLEARLFRAFGDFLGIMESGVT